MYEIRVSKLFRKQFAKLSDESKEKVISRLERIQQDPFHNKRLVSEFMAFRVRINLHGADYRIVYVVQERTIVIVVLFTRKYGYSDINSLIRKEL